MSSSGFARLLIPAAVGIAGGYYIFNRPLQELTGKTASDAPKHGRSQAVKDETHKDGFDLLLAPAPGLRAHENCRPSAGAPHPPLRDGTTPGSQHDGPTVAGTSTDSRKSFSADHNVKTRSDPKAQDGTGGGGVGVAEMRERKMQGQGLPSKQGGHTPAKPVEATAGEYGGMPKSRAK